MLGVLEESGEFFELLVKESDSILKLKSRIYLVKQIECERQSIFVNGQEYPDNTKISKISLITGKELKNIQLHVSEAENKN